jgi:hypothetical protein
VLPLGMLFVSFGLNRFFLSLKGHSLSFFFSKDKKKKKKKGYKIEGLNAV